MRSVFVMLSLGLVTGCNDSAFGPRYFVKLDAEPAKVASTTKELADVFGIKIIHTYDSVSEGFATNMPPFVADEIAKLDEVKYVKEAPPGRWTPPNEVPEPIDPPDSEVPEGIERVGGPYGYDMSGSGIEVAVVDTGVDGFHKDLHVIAEFDAVCKSDASDCANGGDPQGHGTHVAGTIGAVGDNGGVVGVAPGIPIHAVRVLNKDGSGSWTDIIAGLEYVMDHPEIRVVNMSLGGQGNPSPGDEMYEAIRRLEQAGVHVIIAAGNNAANTNGFVPAGFDLGVVVSAYDASGGSDRGFAYFSNYGTAVDIAAPGVAIKSTFPGDEYASLDGTSMATPHVAGIAAVYAYEHPSATPENFRNDLINSGDYVGGGSDHPEPLADLPAVLR